MDVACDVLEDPATDIRLCRDEECLLADKTDEYEGDGSV